MIQGAIRVDPVDSHLSCGVQGSHARFHSEPFRGLSGYVVVKIAGARGMVLKRVVAGQSSVSFAHHGVLRGTAVEISSQIVTGRGGFQWLSGHPAAEDNGILMGYRNRPRLFNGVGQRLCELQHPALPGLLEIAPIGVIPIDYPWRLRLVLLPIACRAVGTVTDARPEGHVNENPLDGVLSHDLPQASESVFPVRRVGTDQPGTAFHDTSVTLRGQDAPSGVFLACPAIEDDDEVSQSVKTPATAFADDLAKEVAPFQVGVHLSHFGAPQAKARAGVCVLHQRLKARPRDAIHVLNWIEATQEQRVPVGHVGIYQ